MLFSLLCDALAHLVLVGLLLLPRCHVELEAAFGLERVERGEKLSVQKQAAPAPEVPLEQALSPEMPAAAPTEVRKKKTGLILLFVIIWLLVLILGGLGLMYTWKKQGAVPKWVPEGMREPIRSILKIKNSK